jgi:hypothetical protein
MRFLYLFLFVTIVSCSVSYKFNDVSVDSNLKTFKVTYFENKARYVNPQLTPKLTDKLRQKIINQTKLNNTNGDADIEISGYVSEYSVTTSGVGNGSTASSNRLNVGLVVNIKNNKDPNKTVEENINRNFDFPSNLTLSQAEARLNEDIIKNVVDEVFNKLFSKW